MTRRAAAFRQIEITRLIRGVEAAGQKVKRIGFDEAGKPVAILSGDEAEAAFESAEEGLDRLRRARGWER